MDFERLFEGPAVLGKQLEVRWFHHDAVLEFLNEKSGKKRQKYIIRHHMPFLRRSLSYIRDHRKVSKRRGRKVSSRSLRSKKEKKEHSKRGRRTRKKLDLLYRIFQYRTRRFNKALSTAPSRATRSEVAKNKLFLKEISSKHTTYFKDSPTKRHGREKGIKDGNEKELKDEPSTNSFEDTLSSNGMAEESLNRSLEQTASCFGKTFPSYNPFQSGEWNPPKEARDSFELFCAVNRELARKELSPGLRRNEKLVEEKLKEIRSKLGQSELMYWKQEEAWDKQRYIREKNIYDQARQCGSASEVAELTLLRAANGCASAAAAAVATPDKAKSGRFAMSKEADTNSGINKSSKVFYHYFYFGKHDTLEVQVEMRQDRRCPLCFFNAASDAGIILHCTSTHGKELTFEGGIDEEANLHIAVKSNPLRGLPSTPEFEQLQNFCSVSSKSTRKKVHIPFIKKPINETALLDPITRKRKIRLLETENPEAISQYIVTDNVPIRQYFHSRTNLPMLDGEWENDSDDEPDNEWIHKISEELMDDFGDVSEKEKVFMKLWNRFIKLHTVIADRAIAKKCMVFLSEHRNELITFDLRQNFLLHLFNLWDNCVISSSNISKIMMSYDELAAQHQSRNINFDNSDIMN